MSLDALKIRLLFIMDDRLYFGKMRRIDLFDTEYRLYINGGVLAFRILKVSHAVR